MNHKDLNRLLDAMLRQAKQCHQNTGHVVPFATVLTSQGKVAHLAAPARPGHFSVQDTIRTLEGGLSTRARQGMCRAVGICFETRTNPEAGEATDEGIYVLVEHQDGGVCQVVLPYARTGPGQVTYGHAISTSTAPRFFANAMTRSA